MKLFNSFWGSFLGLIGGFCIIVVIGKMTAETTSPARAQVFGTNYAWHDSQTVTITAIDCVFTTPWEQVTIKASGDAWVRFGASDTSSWSSREWYNLESGEALSFGPATKLKRLEFKSNAGNVVMYQLGYKKTPQF